MSFADIRDLAVAVGDALAVLAGSSLGDYPTIAGLSFEEKSAQATGRLAALEGQTRPEWKKRLLRLTLQEVLQAIEYARLRDEGAMHRLFCDAEMHFQQYERGEEPRTTFIAGPDGIRKIDDS